MDFRKVTPNGGSASVTLPKQELRELGVVDEEGEIRDGQHARVTHDGDGRFTVDLMGAD